MSVRRQIRLIRAQSPGPLGRVAHPAFFRVYTGNTDDFRMRICSANRRRCLESASPIGAIASAVSCSEQDVRASVLKAGHYDVKWMRRIVTVVARMTNREIP